MRDVPERHIPTMKRSRGADVIASSLCIQPRFRIAFAPVKSKHAVAQFQERGIYAASMPLAIEAPKRAKARAPTQYEPPPPNTRASLVRRNRANCRRAGLV